MKCILSTCGTSLLTNGASNELRGLITRHANAINLNAIDGPARALLETHCQQRKQQILAESDLGQLQILSAELNGIIRLYDQQIRPEHKADQHILVCTDTWLGETTARILSTGQKAQTCDIMQ